MYLILLMDGKRYELDALPIDAIALALKQIVPIYAAEAVMDKCGVSLKEYIDGSG